MDDTFLTYTFKKPEYIQESAKTPFSDFIGIEVPQINQNLLADYNRLKEKMYLSKESEEINKKNIEESSKIENESKLENNSEIESVVKPKEDVEKIDTPLPITDEKKLLKKYNGRALSMSEFKKELLPYAKRVAERLKVEPDVVLAQAFLESGGFINKPLFGIKAQKGYKGKSKVYNTKEQVGDKLVGIQDAFREYDSASESFEDYANLISSKRYRSAIGKSPEEYYKIIKKQGYATADHYVKSLIDSYKQMKKS